jgi:toxin ParE1/3/4
MPDRPLEFHPEAEEDYRGAYSWYCERSFPVAERFESAIERALGHIGESPDRWPIHYSQFRKYTLFEFPYKIIYRSDSSRTFVLAIAHGSRKPEYWKKRS